MATTHLTLTQMRVPEGREKEMSTTPDTTASIEELWEHTNRSTIIAIAVVGAAIVVGSVIADHLLHHASSLTAG
jgi:hypothetical protein